MSINAVEKVLWEFGNDPGRIERFRADPDHYLAGYKLEEPEREAIKTVDVKVLADRGVNPLLTLMVWPLLMGPEGMPFAYLDRMNGKMSAPGS